MIIDDVVLNKLEKLSALKIPENKRDEIKNQLNNIVDFVEILNELNIKLDAIVNISVDDSVLIDRIVGRRVCPNCKAGYHVTNLQPKVEGICDICGAELVQRKDDTEETVKNRLSVYANQTKPLLEFYENYGLVKNFDGIGEIDVIFNNIKVALGAK